MKTRQTTESSIKTQIGISFFILAFLFAGTSCKYVRWGRSLQYRQNEDQIQNPVKHLQSLAVAPFPNERNLHPPVSVSSRLASRINFLVNDLRVVRPEQIRRQIQNHEKVNQIQTLKDAQNAVEQLNIDGLLVGHITRYDPYSPPLMELSVMLVTKDQIRTDFDLNQWMNSSKPPVEINQSPSNIYAAETFIYDSKRKDLREQLRSYAHAHTNEDSGFEDENRWLIMEDFVTFIATDITHRLFGKNAILHQLQKRRRRNGAKQENNKNPESERSSTFEILQ